MTMNRSRSIAVNPRKLRVHFFPASDVATSLVGFGYDSQNELPVRTYMRGPWAAIRAVGSDVAEDREYFYQMTSVTGLAIPLLISYPFSSEECEAFAALHSDAGFTFHVSYAEAKGGLLDEIDRLRPNPERKKTFAEILEANGWRGSR